MIFTVFLLKYLKLREGKSDSYIKCLFSNLDQTELKWLDCLLSSSFQILRQLGKWIQLDPGTYAKIHRVLFFPVVFFRSLLVRWLTISGGDSLLYFLFSPIFKAKSEK